MFDAFKSRRPWAAALVTFILGPFIGMLYLNRGRLALLYFALETALTIFSFHLASVANPQTTSWTFGLGLLLRIIGAVHSISIARHRDASERPRWFSRWYAIVAILLAPLAVALTIRAFLFQTFNAVAASMSPTLNIGDYFFVSKFAYRVSLPKRGDLVVFHTQIFGGADYIKRIIGVPGDRVQMRDDRLYINGIIVPEHRIKDFLEPCNPGGPCHVTQYEETLPDGRTYRILDRTANGPFDNTPVFVVPANSYFVLGDNRDNSDDSRADVGFVSHDDIIGRVAYKYIESGHWAWKPVN